MQYPTDTNSLLIGVGAFHDDQSNDTAQTSPQPDSLDEDLELMELATTNERARLPNDVRRRIRIRDTMIVDEKYHQSRLLPSAEAHRPWIGIPNDMHRSYGATPAINGSGPHLTSIQSWLEAPLGRDPFNNIGEVVSSESAVKTVQQDERQKDKSITAATAGSGKSERPAVDRGGETSLAQKAQRS
ncbi:hypothetical protein CMUS01_06924 [Colletotrichum musicola]|uniref:Uncharacterized protein n=1 Tax=Colletotrichum musicola TaxID=2175873 RepID=A0A8H6KJ42_9PEZI|nr:hypothetical protein CMUS01_06924 [Colletotrichum musicola]